MPINPASFTDFIARSWAEDAQLLMNMARAARARGARRNVVRVLAREARDAWKIARHFAHVARVYDTMSGAELAEAFDRELARIVPNGGADYQALSNYPHMRTHHIAVAIDANLRATIPEIIRHAVQLYIHNCGRAVV